MSKSEAGVRGHAVRLIDPPDTVQEIVKRAVTDTGREILFSDQPAKAGVNNLLEIYQLFTAQSREEIEAHFLGKGYAGLKAEVAEVIIEGLRPIQEKYRQLISNPDELNSILDAGANRARAIADLKVDQVKDAVGFVRRRDKSNTASWKFDDV
jgi:tryptophanyl-tRNA synthetase